MVSFRVAIEAEHPESLVSVPRSAIAGDVVAVLPDVPVKQKNLLLIMLSFFIVEGVMVIFNSFVSTVAFKQGRIGEVSAVEML